MKKLFLLHNWNRIGHMFMEPFIHGTLDESPEDTVYLVPMVVPANEAAARIVRRHVRVVPDPGFFPLYDASLKPDARRNGTRLVSWRNDFFAPFYARSLQDPASVRYFSLNEEDLEAGRRIEKELGIPEGAPYVCLHIREPGYLPGLPYHRYRDAAVANFEPAVDALLARGYRVVRIGDPTMTPLTPRPGLIDLPAVGRADPFADIWFTLRGRFMLGTTSGPLNIPLAFNGPPLLVVNKIPTLPIPLPPGSRMLPKMLHSHALGRHLSLWEVKTGGLEFAEAEVYEAHGLRVEENTSGEILDAVREMMDDLEAGAGVRRDHPLQLAYDRCSEDILEFKRSRGEPYMMIRENRLATSFLERHPEFLERGHRVSEEQEHVYHGQE